MLAYIVSQAHVDAIVTRTVGGKHGIGAAKRIANDTGNGEYVCSSDYTPSQIGAALWTENQRPKPELVPTTSTFSRSRQG